MEKIVHKVILKGGKEVLLHDPKIKHKNLAMQAAAPKSKDSQLLLATLFQDELLKILIAQVNGKPVSAAALENLDELFTMSEYRQVMKAVTKLMGDDDAGEPAMEFMPTGDK